MTAAMTGQIGTALKAILAGLAMLFVAHRGYASPPAAQAEAIALAKEPPVVPPPGKRIVEDASGRNQVGKASVYARHFQGHRMADGVRFRHTGTAAASRSLPLGTVARVTNLETGRTAMVTVEDHGPFVRGRAIDVSKATANQLGITRHDGVASVQISPITVPQRDGTVKQGAGAAITPPS
jgi:rare lipoprotein A